MNVTFNIQYSTVYGDEILLNIAPTVAEGETTDASQYKTLSMSTHDGQTWSLDTQLNPAESVSYDYFYSVRNVRGIKRMEWHTVMHRIDLTATNATRYKVEDRWAEIPGDTYLYSSAFTDCVNRRAEDKVKPTGYDTTLRLVVRAPQLRSGMHLNVVGAQPALGCWDITKSMPMTEHNHNEWIVDIDATRIFGFKKTTAGKNDDIEENKTLELKFVALGDKNEIEWETGMNRILTVEPMSNGDVRIVALDQAFFALCDEKMAGTLIPVFSLRSEGSFGVGDFGDLKLMIDWVAQTHQRLLQVLPINDSTSTHTWTDSYPYSCISIFALHPQFCDLRQLPALKDKVEADRFEMLRKELNGLPQVDYERVNNAKTKYLQLLFKQEGKEVLATEDFKEFFKHTEHWLVPYAQYCYLRDKNGTCEFAKWKGHTQWNEADRASLSNPQNKAFKDVAFFYYLQFVLDRQMRSAHDYARARGVILKGDIPIGVNRNGCDVWHEPEYFHLDSQAGAPPDGFSVNGQNWSLPTYNWERMIANGCQWWVRRFQNMQQYFDAYRIDHVLGFFRIWAIPTDCVHGLLGQFQPALAMSREEIKSYGLNFQEDLFTKPFIADWIISRIFKEHAEEVKEKYLQHEHDDIFSLKPEYDTERKVEAAFEGKTTDKDIWLRDGLYALIENVLFVRDRQNPNMFHPRITAQLNFMYEALWQNDKDAFKRLYNDYYYRRHNDFWYREAMKKLPLLSQATRMLVCAEDLGMVPDCVQWVMNELRILSLELQSMPKDPSVEFGHLSRNPYRSVCTLSTHDMPTLRQWWDEDYDRTQKYYNTMLYRGGAAPHPLPGWLARDIVSRQLTSPSMLCVLSLQDWFAIDERIRLADANAERINIPAIPKHYWRYRMHMTIEQLIADKEYNDEVKDLIDEAGRK